MAYLPTQPYKGTRDFYPQDMRIQSWMFNQMRKVVERFGYEEYNGPMLEPFELFAAKSGEELVNQQLYHLIDRGERKMAIRPEMTPTLARMVAGRIHELPRPIRWYSTPNLWRYERPQRGRLREHWQLNVDVLGGDPLLADAEILTLALDVIGAFGGTEHVSIRVNNRRLMDHFFHSALGLTSEATLRVIKAVDARPKIGDEGYSKMLAEARVDEAGRERMERFFGSSFDEMARDFPCSGVDELKGLFGLLNESGVSSRVVFDPTIMRGLDYYTGTVFEMFDTSPENRRAMFGGGRYDNLVGLFCKDKLSGVGFGMGDVTLRNFLETHGLLETFAQAVDVFVSLPKKEVRTQAETLAIALRSRGIRTITPLSIEGFGAQLKNASRHGARYSVLFGDSELAEGKVIIKDMASSEQTLVALDDVVSKLETLLRART